MGRESRERGSRSPTRGSLNQILAGGVFLSTPPLLSKEVIMPREVVKIKSDNPSHNGYYTQWKDQMKPGDEIYNPGAPVKPKQKKKVKL